MTLHRVLCSILAAAWVLGGAATASACTGAEAPSDGASMARATAATVCLINEARQSRGLVVVRTSGSLQRAARRHSRSMVSGAYFAHADPDGGTPVTRLRAAGYIPSARPWRIGETIAWGTPDRATPLAIVRAWLRSPPHRRELLDGHFRDIGVGIALGTPRGLAPGATFTADFGARG
jgi:uncharacterized protein YkwD